MEERKRFFLKEAKTFVLAVAGPACTARIDPSEESKAFFFEKKKQKTFVLAVADLSGGARQREQTFFGPISEKGLLAFCWSVSEPNDVTSVRWSNMPLAMRVLSQDSQPAARSSKCLNAARAQTASIRRQSLLFRYFGPAVAASPSACTPGSKSLLVLFSKKEPLALLLAA